MTSTTYSLQHIDLEKHPYPASSVGDQTHEDGTDSMRTESSVRKGGRRRVNVIHFLKGTKADRLIKLYATEGERKERNRQAQQNFRVRRKAFIEQLEATVKENGTKIATLHKEQGRVREERDMFRYQNGLWEGMLWEKGKHTATAPFQILMGRHLGINVKAEVASIERGKASVSTTAPCQVQASGRPPSKEIAHRKTPAFEPLYPEHARQLGKSITLSGLQGI